MLKYLTAVFFLFSGSAFAANVDFSTVMVDQDDKPIADCMGQEANKCQGAPPMTLGRLSMHALTAVFEDEKNMTGEEKFRRGELAMRVYRGKVVELTAEDTAMLKKVIAKGYGPFIVMKAWNLLEGKN